MHPNTPAHPAPVKRVLLCSKSSVYTDAVLKSLSSEPSIELVGLVDSRRLMKKGEHGLKGIWRLIRRTGFFYTAYLGVITSPWLRLPHVPKWSAMREWAQQKGIAYHVTDDVNAEETQQFISDQRPDLVVAAHFNQIFSASSLENKPYDLLNIHPGLLPGARGVDPVFYDLLRNKEDVGVTLHRIDKEIDAGAIISSSIERPPRRTLFRINLALFQRGGDLVRHYVIGESTPVTGSNAKEQMPHYDSWPTAKAVWKFLFSGNRL